MSSAHAFAASLLVAGSMMGVGCSGGPASSLETGDTPGASTTSSGGAGPDTSRAVPQAIFEGRLEKGTNDDCNGAGPLFALGAFGPPATPIKDGESVAQGTAKVSCSVTAAGSDDFDVVGSVALSGASGGLFRVDGRFKATGEQSGIHAIFSSGTSGDTYEQTDRACVVRYTTQFQSAAPGRVWGEITCPKAETPARRPRARRSRSSASRTARRSDHGALAGFSSALRQSSSAARCCPWGTPPRRRATFALWTSPGIGTRTVVGPPRVGSRTLARL